MPFIRLSDNYIDHPKFLALSASAFRLWHEGMAFCRKHQTDGLITLPELQGFRYYQAVRVRELATPPKEGVVPLWETVPSGYQVHDYLFWNLSKAEEQAERESATKRMRDLRQRRRDTEHTTSHRGERLANVQDRIGSEKAFTERESERKPALSSAERFMDAYRAQWKITYGYESSLLLKPLEYMQLEEQLGTHDEAQLFAALAAYFMTDDTYVRKAKHPLALFIRDPLKHLAQESAPAEPAPYECPHTPKCTEGRWKCQQKTDMANYKARQA